MRTPVSPHGTRSLRPAGFTLVELLVVIGIIALLISILLPSLGKARQAANSAACESNEHQMGVALAMYAAQNHGYLPYGNAWSSTSGGYWAAPAWAWPDTLSLEVSRGTQDQNTSGEYGQYSYLAPNIANMAFEFSGMFHDKDVPGNGWANRACDYECNPRIMPDNTVQDYYANTSDGSSSHYLGLRKIANLRNSQSVMMVWCSGVQITSDGQDHGGPLTATQIDEGNLSTPLGLIYPPLPSYSWAAPMAGNRIALGSGNSPAGCSYSGGDTIASLKSENVDYFAGYDNAADMRFRHNNNTSCNGLFIDGHCESRHLGSVLGRDILVNAPGVYASAPGL